MANVHIIFGKWPSNIWKNWQRKIQGSKILWNAFFLYVVKIKKDAQRNICTCGADGRRNEKQYASEWKKSGSPQKYSTIAIDICSVDPYRLVGGPWERGKIWGFMRFKRGQGRTSTIGLRGPGQEVGGGQEPHFKFYNTFPRAPNSERPPVRCQNNTYWRQSNRIEILYIYREPN